MSISERIKKELKEIEDRWNIKSRSEAQEIMVEYVSKGMTPDNKYNSAIIYITFDIIIETKN